jgi:hypothetical protein
VCAAPLGSTRACGIREKASIERGLRLGVGGPRRRSWTKKIASQALAFQRTLLKFGDLWDLCRLNYSIEVAK